MLKEVEHGLRQLQVAQKDLLGMSNTYLARHLPSLSLKDAAEIYCALGLEFVLPTHPTRHQFHKCLEARWDGVVDQPATFEDNSRGEIRNSARELYHGWDIYLGEELVGFYSVNPGIGHDPFSMVDLDLVGETDVWEVKKEADEGRSLFSGVYGSLWQPVWRNENWTELAFQTHVRNRVTKIARDAYLSQRRIEFEVCVYECLKERRKLLG